MIRAWPLWLVLGCSDNEIKAIRLDALVVTLGDFDDMSDTLVSMDIASSQYDGFIVQATYDPADERLHRGDIAAQVEGLLTDHEGEFDLDAYNGVFVNSGTRGLNRVQYNDSLVADDAMLLDTENLQKTCDFATRGGSLVVSDWAYDLIEFCWPDQITFFGESAGVDGAQVGVADGEVLATVGRTTLAEAIGPTVAVEYNYTAWSVIESVSADTEVLLSGNIRYQPSADEAIADLDDVPLLVRFTTGSGQVIFSTFHWNAQNPGLAATLMLEIVEGLNSGSGTDNTEATDGT